MEQKNDFDRARVIKMASDYIVKKLVSWGMPLEDAMQLSRQELLDAMATKLLTKTISESEIEEVVDYNGPPSQTGDEFDDDGGETKPGDAILLQRERFEWEKKCWEREFQAAEARREREFRAIEAEREREFQAAEADRRARLDIERSRVPQATDQGGNNDPRRSPAARVKMFGDAMRSAAVKLGSDQLDIIPFFDNVERLFVTLEVPDSLKVDLIRPFLTERASKLISQLDNNTIRNYERVKKYLLSQLRLSPRLLLDRFNSASRQTDETGVLFIARLKTLLKYYCDSRSVNSFDRLCSLIICDRYKSTLSDDCLNHVLSVEATKTLGWMEPDQLADCVDRYYSNRVGGKPSAQAVGVTNRRPYPAKNTSYGNNSRTAVGNAATIQSDVLTVNSGINNVGHTRSSISCWYCRGPHKKSDCPRLSSRSGQSAVKSTSGSQGASTTVQANEALLTTTTSAKCIVSDPVMGGNDGCSRFDYVNNTDTAQSIGGCCEEEDDVLTGLKEYDADIPAQVTMDQTGTTGQDNITAQTADGLADTDLCVAKAECAAGGNQISDMSKLCYVQICVKEIPDRILFCLNDSGSQLTIVSKRLFDNSEFHRCGKICIRGLIGNSVQADLTYITVSLPECDRCCLRVLCAVSDCVNEDILMPSDVLGRLYDQHNHCVASCNTATVGNSDDVTTSNDNDTDSDDGNDNAPGQDQTSDVLDVDNVDSKQSDLGMSTVGELQCEQQNDDTLTTVLELARKDKSNYFIKDGLLFCNERIAGQVVECLVVPNARRNYVIKMAHCVTGGHFNYRKTRDRIKMSALSWPTLVQDCKEFIKGCDVCQRTSRVLCYERIPIQAIPRATSLFAHFFSDVFGPIFPNQRVRYNYCLVLVDSYSLWISAYPLHNVTSKNICTALINMFSFTGLSSEVTFLCTDGASYFKSELTREFLKRIGVSPRFHTPYASWSTGLVERHLQTCKRVLAKLAMDHPRTWYEHLPYALWAMRESVSSPLQIQPFMLVTGGRKMRGPLSILKESWMGFRDLPVSLGKRTEDFLQDVQTSLQLAEEYSKHQTEIAQQRYVHNYNLRTRGKKFQVGQDCLILQPDDTSSAMFSRWKGPAQIIECRYPDSYLVEYNGRRYHLHANHLRPYYVQVDSVTCCFDELQSSHDDCELDSNDICISDVSSNTCSIIYKTDIEFGDIGLDELSDSEASVNNVKMPSSIIDRTMLSYLSDSQYRELMSLLDEFHGCFSDTPGLCKAVVHKIPTTDGFVPKRLKGYRIPETLRPEVERQIAELLRLGFIRESTSPMSSPIVTVVKPSGGIRVCVNYQYLNKFTVPDQIPLPDIVTIIHRIGKANFISKFDAPSGYHQCEIDECDRWKTAFVCGTSLFEWVRCPFGLKSSGCTFTRALNRVLLPVRDICENFVDDMAVHSDQWESHLNDLRRYFTIIKQSGFTLSLKKSEFAKHEILFLGHFLGSGSRRADPSRVEAIKLLRVPETKKQLRQILGLFCHFQEYIPCFAELARPLTDLTSKKVPNRIPWGEEEGKAFESLKTALIKATQEPIGVIDCSRPLVCRVDASDFAISGILQQDDARGTPRPVAFTSAKLTPSQRHWSTIEKECYAICFSLKKWRCFIYGVPTTVITDHNPLTYLTDRAPNNSKLMRWLLAMQEFNNVTYTYRAGVHNEAADCLSRMVHGDSGE